MPIPLPSMDTRIIDITIKDLCLLVICGAIGLFLLQVAVLFIGAFLSRLFTAISELRAEKVRASKRERGREDGPE